jgi:translocation and assembly module TamB
MSWRSSRLFAGESGGAGTDVYRQTLPFRVYLNMEGKLMNPEISFYLDLPAEHRTAAGGAIYGRLQEINENESERNKQVFALLVLNQFLPESPLETPAGSPIAGRARSSASRLLTQQLIHLSGRYIRGVDITFDVESYEGLYNGDLEGRTELQMEVSRRFFDERVEVRIGGNVDLEGERRREAGLSDFAGDVVIEYRLTEDGRLRMAGFRQHHYGNIIDGEYVETGVSLRFGRDFHRFRRQKQREEPEE